MSRLLLHAPSVHTGGGLRLLQALLSSTNIGELWANLDIRARNVLSLPRGAQCHYVHPSLLSRLAAECRLMRAARCGEPVLCFHGLPPVFPIQGRVIVFQQNRNLLGSNSLAEFSGWLRTRILLERILSRCFKSHVHEYIVQTPSMQSAVRAWHGVDPKVRVIPFMGVTESAGGRSDPATAPDFIYVAEGESHKNHRKLLEAWILLAAEGVFPSLATTISPRYGAVSREMEEAASAHGLRIVNLGLQPHERILELYRSARALIFPSTSESFGLPLVEATRAGLPILASELDFVRDVCSPVETFDPRAAVSIARAVKRFLKLPAPVVTVRSADEFLAELGR